MAAPSRVTAVYWLTEARKAACAGPISGAYGEPVPSFRALAALMLMSAGCATLDPEPRPGIELTSFDSATASCREAPLYCAKADPGEEAILPQVPEPPPAAGPTTGSRWLQRLLPFLATGAKGSPQEPPEGASKDRPPQGNVVQIANDKWRPAKPNAPRYLPCRVEGYGGPGPSRPDKAPSDWMRCTYTCGRYEVRLYDIRLRKDADGRPKNAHETCQEPINLKRAEEHARSYDAALKAQGK